MAKELVPIEDLPAEVRANVKPGDATFKAYAQHYEKLHGLQENSLGGARYESDDPLRLLATAAKDAAKPRGATTAPPVGVPYVPPAYDPSKGGGEFQVGPFNTGIATPEWLERGLAGVGKSFADTGRGIGQLFGAVPQSDVDEAAQRDAPLMHTGAGLVGNVTGFLSQMALPAGVARGVPALAASPYTQAALAGGAMGAAQPVESGNNRGVQAAVGAGLNVAGQGAVEGAKALFSPAWQGAKQGVADLAKAAIEKHGIPLRAADITDSSLLRGTQTVVDALPFSGAKDFRATQQSAFNKRLAGTMGEDADDLTAALRTAKPRLSKAYDDLAERNTAVFDDTAHLKKLDKALQTFRRNDTSENKQVSQALDEYLNNLLFNPENASVNAAGRLQMPGKLYKEFRSEARVLSQSASAKGDGPLAGFYKTVKETLDDAMRKSSSPEDAKLWKLTDKQYGNMKTLESIAPKDATGDADFTKLAGVLTREGAQNLYPRNAFVYGQGDQTLPELARIGTTFMGRGLPPSPWRAVGKQLKDIAPTGTGAGALSLGSMYALNHGGEHPVLGAAGALAALAAAGKAGGAGLNSKWFANGVPLGLNAVRAAEQAGVGRLPGAAAHGWMRGVTPQPEEGP